MNDHFQLHKVKSAFEPMKCVRKTFSPHTGIPYFLLMSSTEFQASKKFKKQ